TPVSLIDLFPTLVDLCDLTEDTQKNPRGHPLDGHSLKPLLENPQQGEWEGPRAALTALYKWRIKYDPAKESYALRYIRYENGREELYNTSKDPLEWENLAAQTNSTELLNQFRCDLLARLPKPGEIPQQPDWKPQDSNNPIQNGEEWKARYFRNHPEADTNGDGKLTWPELKAHRTKESASE
ncbi:MAG: hypothetical protein ACO3FE_09400, partial [Planctomycetaceae bacterium]